MLSTAGRRTRKRVLIIEPQALFAPYFADTIATIGFDVVGVDAAPRARTLQRLRPDIVVLDAGHLPSPLRTVRALRAHLPGAHLVVYAPLADEAWPLLAQGVGADVVMGPRADEPDLLAALAA
ncbi:MAG: response regulator transcription factor [Candidatus Eremiobacteraeota bacterium]|nr:response regulator transcription factor [Candidatus Eremiobacteraeota bacterium]MBC5821473.1 response regulator transcription factor [Candidatus Eremiobacteraeota bacterium]